MDNNLSGLYFNEYGADKDDQPLRIRHEITSEIDLALYPISVLGKELCRLTTRPFACLELE